MLSNHSPTWNIVCNENWICKFAEYDLLCKLHIIVPLGEVVHTQHHSTTSCLVAHFCTLCLSSLMIFWSGQTVYIQQSPYLFLRRMSSPDHQQSAVLCDCYHRWYLGDEIPRKCSDLYCLSYSQGTSMLSSCLHLKYHSHTVEIVGQPAIIKLPVQSKVFASWISTS